MEIKLIEMIMIQPFVFIALAVLVWVLTYIIKKPIKKYTNKITDSQKKKLANKLILLIPFVLAAILFYVYNSIIEKTWKPDFEYILGSAFSIAALAITIYNVFEGLKGKKVNMKYLKMESHYTIYY